MMKSIIILGAGGHAKVLIDAIQDKSRIIGVSDPKFKEDEKLSMGIPCMAERMVLEKDPNDFVLVNAIGSVKNLEAREKLFQKFRSLGFIFETIIQPSSIIGMDVTIEQGAQIMAGSVIQAGCTIGENSIINTRASIDHDCRIGRSVHVAPGCVLSGNVRIQDLTHIGTGAIVIQNISIGKKVLIPAGAVIREDILKYGRVQVPRSEEA